MARNIDANAINELNQVVSFPVELVHFRLNNTSLGNLFLSTSYKEFEFDGNTYTPGANVLGFSAIEETKDAKTNSINISLNGVPNDIIGALEPMVGSTIGGEVTVYQSFWDEENGTLLQKTVADGGGPEVYEKWRGIITSFSTTEENQPSGSVRINVDCRSSIGLLLDTKSGRYTSDSSIRRDFPEDRSMEFVESLVDWNPNFGAEE